MERERWKMKEIGEKTDKERKIMAIIRLLPVTLFPASFITNEHCDTNTLEEVSEVYRM